METETQMNTEEAPQETPQPTATENAKDSSGNEPASEDPTFAPSEMTPEPVLDTTAQSGDEPDSGTPDPDTDPGMESDDNNEDPTARIEELEALAADLNDKLLRALAETENVRRRAQRDKEDASKYAVKSFAENMLRVSDNLGRALSSIDVDARAGDANLENIAVGVEMVQKELLTAFERAAVKPIEAIGARFDPMLHEALFEIQDPDRPAGTVAQVMEDGFTLHGRTLRAAKVGVTKGGPKVAPPKQADTEGEEAAGDATQREGQQAYETQGGGASETGGKLDQEL
jgi:molecular chaperone GrpE